MEWAEIWACIAWVAAAIVLLANAVEKIMAAARLAKAPNARQDERLDKLEEWRKEVDQRLVRGNAHFEAIDEGSRVMQKALLALLAHGIDGNNTEQMQRAKEDLETHLINR